LIDAFNSATAAHELLLTTATEATDIADQLSNGVLMTIPTIDDATASAVAALAAFNAAMETFNTALAAYSNASSS
jgi:hypothetical protein